MLSIASPGARCTQTGLLRSSHLGQLTAAQLWRTGGSPKRRYADSTSPYNPNQIPRSSIPGKPKVGNSNSSANAKSSPVVFPGTESKTALRKQPAPPGAVAPAGLTVPREVQPSSVHADITPKSIPKLPPTPEAVGAAVITASSGNNPQSQPFPRVPASSLVAKPLLAADESKSIADTLKSAPPDPADSKPATTINPSKPVSNTITAPAPTPASSSAPPVAPPTQTNALPPPSPPRKRRRFRRYAYILALLTAGIYGGGTYYALENDTFHDYFTEFVPGAEDAVLYFEERRFRQRFPQLRGKPNQSAPPPREAGTQVTIPKRSGVTWKVSDQSKSPADSPSAKKETAKASSTAEKKQSGGPAAAEPQQKTQSALSKELVKAEESKPVEKPKDAPRLYPTPVEETRATGDKPSKTNAQTTASTQIEPPLPMPARFKPVEPIDPISTPDASEPLVQDIVKSVNSIITIINADHSQSAYSPVIDQARSQLAKVGGRIRDLQISGAQEAEERVNKISEESKAAASLLVQRFSENEKRQEAQWREELAEEKDKITHEYESKLKAALNKEREIDRKQQENLMLEQALKLKHAFISQVKDAVERERSGRLAKMDQLTESVKELESLTGQWSSVVDSNLKTQHLQVAVEGLRNIVEKASAPRPFVQELVAVKELGQKNDVIDAAIDCVQPASYHRGVPTNGMLITRFRGVASEIRKAALLPEDSGIASHAAGRLFGKLLLSSTPSTVSSRGSLSDVGAVGQGEPVGDDVDSVLRRAEVRLEEGDLENAAREVNSLQGWAGRLGKDWVKDVRRVCEVREAVDIIATEARLQSLKIDADGDE